MTKKQIKVMDDRISKVYAVSCHGVQISIWDMGKIMAKGRELVASGADDQALGQGLRAFVDTLAVSLDKR